MRDERVKITLTKEEHEQIKRNAKAFDMNVSQYIRMITLEPEIFGLSYPCVEEHTEFMNERRKAIIALIYRIKKTDEFVPADLEYIYENSNDILKSMEQLLKDVQEESLERKKILPKMIRKMLKEKRERYK